MGHCCGSAGQRFGSAEAHREIGDLQRVEEGECLLLTALKVQREGRARPRAMAVEDVGLARTLFEETQIADLLDLRVAAEEITNLGGILAGAVHAELERLEASQKHPR